MPPNPAEVRSGSLRCLSQLQLHSGGNIWTKTSVFSSSTVVIIIIYIYIYLVSLIHVHPIKPHGSGKSLNALIFLFRLDASRRL